MILGKTQIEHLIEDGYLAIERRNHKGELNNKLSLNPASLDVHLHSITMVEQHPILSYIDCIKPIETQVVANKIDPGNDNGIVLYPDYLYLATIEEGLIKTPDFVIPDLSGKSSVGRLGITVEVSAGWGDPGFQGYYTLEIIVKYPIKVYVGMPIAQIRFNAMQHISFPNLHSGEVYAGKYQNQKQEPTLCQFDKNYDPETGWM